MITGHPNYEYLDTSLAAGFLVSDFPLCCNWIWSGFLLDAVLLL